MTTWLMRTRQVSLIAVQHLTAHDAQADVCVCRHPCYLCVWCGPSVAGCLSWLAPRQWVPQGTVVPQRRNYSSPSFRGLPCFPVIGWYGTQPALPDKSFHRVAVRGTDSVVCTFLVYCWAAACVATVMVPLVRLSLGDGYAIPYSGDDDSGDDDSILSLGCHNVGSIWRGSKFCSNICMYELLTGCARGEFANCVGHVRVCALAAARTRL